jgi:chromate transport protein ChrA
MPLVRHFSMSCLERILRALFWLPILLGGIVGLALVEPGFHRIGLISAALLFLFIIFVLIQVALERRSLSRAAPKREALIEKPPTRAEKDSSKATGNSLEGL